MESCNYESIHEFMNSCQFYSCQGRHCSSRARCWLASCKWAWSGWVWWGEPRALVGRPVAFLREYILEFCIIWRVKQSFNKLFSAQVLYWLSGTASDSFWIGLGWCQDPHNVVTVLFDLWSRCSIQYGEIDPYRSEARLLCLWLIHSWHTIYRCLQLCV